MAIQNAWQLSRSSNNESQFDHLGFCRRIACSILQTNAKSINQSVGRPSQRENLDSRYDGMHHYVIQQNRKTTTRCIKCDIGLHFLGHLLPL
ncbi:hypothetical protein NQ315_012057, partial [Exocentrus adspersus]